MLFTTIKTRRKTVRNSLLTFRMHVQLPCHVENFVAITLLEFGWSENVISIAFEERWRKKSAIWIPGTRIMAPCNDHPFYCIDIYEIETNCLNPNVAQVT